MKTKKTRFGENAENQKEFQRFLEAAGIKSWTPYSNDTLRAQMSASQKPRSRVFAWLILNSWGLAVKSAFAKCGNRAARYVDIASELELDEKHVRKLALELEARGWIGTRDKRIYPESHPVLKEVMPDADDDVSLQAAWEPYLSYQRHDLIDLRERAHALWNEFRQQEREARAEFEVLSIDAKQALIELAKNTPVPSKEPVVPASHSSGTENPILTVFKKEETSISVSRTPTPSALANDPATASGRSVGRPLNSPATPAASPTSLLFEALNRYGPADEQAAKTLLDKCRGNSPDATVGEIVHFIHEKGAQSKARKPKNPIGFLITYVPLCFPAALQALRQEREWKAWPPSAEFEDLPLEKQIELAISFAENPTWADHEQRADWIADLEELEKHHPEAVARVRAAMANAKGGSG